jgi:aryl-alcohol dehydrogenase-like predicted oxidoreductase
MRYRALGDSGLLVSVIGLGGNNFGGADVGYGPAAGARGGRKYIRLAVEKSLTR